MSDLEPPGPAFDRYLAEVDRTYPERLRYRSGPARRWQRLPVVVTLGGAFALADGYFVGVACGEPYTLQRFPDDAEGSPFAYGECRFGEVILSTASSALRLLGSVR